ncbi:DUF4157 domain-containing protein [Micromonospora rubida]|uniref:DUF4157 domain-containing protein n=1 Tax=Micromonospora rubida TaxID=2697657 RepID=A0ABW7SND8_9ACTN
MRLSQESRAPGSSRPSRIAGTGGPSDAALDGHVLAAMEQRFGHSFADVRVHADPAANQAADRLGAAAYTTGDHIYFGSGRYAPGTPAGERLLAHELAHVVHASVAPTVAPGIAPDASGSERGARTMADAALRGGLRGSTARQTARRWGTRHAVQPERIVTAGSEVHKGYVGAPDWAAGQQGPPIGEVHVRTGEEIELKGGSRIPNVVALEYSGALTAESRWLQYVWFEMLVTTPDGTTPLSGTVPTSSGDQAFTTNPRSPVWKVDSAAQDPFYDAAGASLRTQSSTTMFDAPGGGSVRSLASAAFAAVPEATSVRFVAHFSAFLIQRGLAMYEVDYTAATASTQVRGSTVTGAIGYSVTGRPVRGLPNNLRELLVTRNPDQGVK